MVQSAAILNLHTNYWIKDMDIFKLIIIAIRIALGGLFIYAGIAKFTPKAPAEQPPATQSSEVAAEKPELPPHVVKIKALIGGMKQTGYFWPMLGVAEILCGVFLISQALALLGAVMLVPLTLNIFLFHLYLEPHETGELIMTAVYFAANILLLGYDYQRLKLIFLPVFTKKSIA